MSGNPKHLHITNTFLASEKDIKNRSWRDWLSAHYSFGKPLHRYAGELTLFPYEFQFTGIDKNTNAEFILSVKKDQISTLYTGFDSVFTIFESRNLGITWKPIRITLTQENIESNFYLITFSENRYTTSEWFEILKKWLS